MLKVSKLSSTIEKKEVLKDVSFDIKEGEIVAIMGPNGSGKSSLAQIIMGNPDYLVKGNISFKNKDISKLTTNERSVLGIYLAFQYPFEIPGLNLAQFLRASLNARLPKEKKLNVFEFRKLLREKLKELDMEESFMDRNLNEGFSGGEKKRTEILQLLLLKPKLIILDETDSGLDVDALKIVFKAIKEYKEKNKDTSIMLITHYNRVFEYISPDRVLVLKKGEIIKEGSKDLLKYIEDKGYKGI
jgi:Fe-S cluster assembly ATP-binding protein